MVYQLTFRVLSFIFLTSMSFHSSWASSDDEEEETYSPTQWHADVTRDESFLDTYDESQLEDEDYRNKVESYFFDILLNYKVCSGFLGDTTAVLKNRLKFENKVRTYIINFFHKIKKE